VLTDILRPEDKLSASSISESSLSDAPEAAESKNVSLVSPKTPLVAVFKGCCPFPTSRHAENADGAPPTVGIIETSIAGSGGAKVDTETGTTGISRDESSGFGAPGANGDAEAARAATPG
jgi:hypothetical protein